MLLKTLMVVPTEVTPRRSFLSRLIDANDTAGIAAYAELAYRFKRGFLVVRRDCLLMEMVAKDEFKVSDLPRVPIHTPRKRPTEQEAMDILRANLKNHVPMAVDRLIRELPYLGGPKQLSH